MKALRLSAALFALTLSGGAAMRSLATYRRPRRAASTGRTAGSAPRGLPVAAKLGDGPWDFKTEKANLHVEVMVRGIDHPWASSSCPMATCSSPKRSGKLRVVRKGVLDPNPVTGLLPILPGGLGGLMDIALHPNFARNHWVYMTAKGEKDQNSTVAVMRGRWDGNKHAQGCKGHLRRQGLVRQGAAAGPLLRARARVEQLRLARIVFGRDGKLYVTSGDRQYGELSQLKGTYRQNPAPQR